MTYSSPGSVQGLGLTSCFQDPFGRISGNLEFKEWIAQLGCRNRNIHAPSASREPPRFHRI